MTAPFLKPEPRPGLFRRTPPAIFPSILGLLGLGIAWRRGQDAFGIPEAPVEGYLGAVSLLYLFAVVAYGAKVMFRPGVVAEDFRTLPGRAGLSTMTMSGMLFAAVLVPYAPAVAVGVVALATALHLAIALATLRLLLTGPEEARVLTPAAHLSLVGMIVAPIAAVPLGFTGLSQAIFWVSLAAALVVWAAALRPLLAGTAPAPLRPLQAIHLAPAALTGTVAFLLGMPALGTALAVAGVLLFGLLAFRARWLTEAGFSGFWGSFTFPVASFAGVLFFVAEAQASPAVRTAGGLVLVFATLIIPPIALKVMQLWAKGVLAQKTNAARA